MQGRFDAKAFVQSPGQCHKFALTGNSVEILISHVFIELNCNNKICLFTSLK